MAEPILVIAFGSWATSAAVVTGDRTGLVREPATDNPRWPSAACVDGDELVVGTAARHRRDVLTRTYVEDIRGVAETGGSLWLGARAVNGQELLVTYLAALRTESERAYGTRIERLALTVPAGTGRDVMVTVATAAGFPDVELVGNPVAAALDPALDAKFPDGALVLVCDLGITWTVALVRTGDEHGATIAHETSAAGRDLDALLVEDLRVRQREWTEPAIAAGGDAGTLARYRAADLVRRLKHRLATVPEATDHLDPAAPAYRLTRAELERYAEPSLRWLLASCRAVVARAGATLGEVAAVVLAGGGSRLAAAAGMLGGGLARPVLHAPEPELAVIRGAARCAAGAAGRRVSATAPGWRVEPVIWEVPTGRARLVRWLVDLGQPYPSGAVLARARASDDRVYDLIAGRDGILAEQLVPAGGIVESGAVSAMARSVGGSAGSRPTRRHQLEVSGEWLLTPDRRLLVECEDTGAYVRLRSIADATVVGELRPGNHGVTPRRGRVFASPAGRLALIAWDVDGQYFVWDLLSGRLAASFRDTAPPLAVLVNEAHWRLLAEADRKVQVGRYRRDVATVWDLQTGARVRELVGDDVHRHQDGYVDHSGADSFATIAHSPDGRLRAVADRTTVAVLEAETEQEVFRADSGSARSIRTAFSADGRHLLASWKAGAASRVDIWKL
jgi:molecular chaperone DnaK